jgi:hypothetical protein
MKILKIMICFNRRHKIFFDAEEIQRIGLGSNNSNNLTKKNMSENIGYKSNQIKHPIRENRNQTQ